MASTKPVPHSRSADVVVEVRNLAGAEWTEVWSREKLAYFILMSEAPLPKFESCARLEWVPYDTNSYRWDKRLLDRQEFERIAEKWPGRSPIPFDPSACDWVQFSFSNAGAGFNPNSEPKLFKTLVELGTEELRYETFDYARARHVFALTCSDAIRDSLISTHAGALNRIWRQLFVGLRDEPSFGIIARFLVREGSFELPITIWYET